MPKQREPDDEAETIVMECLSDLAHQLRRINMNAAVDVAWMLFGYMDKHGWISDDEGRTFIRGKRPPGWGAKVITDLATKHGWKPPGKT